MDFWPSRAKITLKETGKNPTELSALYLDMSGTATSDTNHTGSVDYSDLLLTYRCTGTWYEKSRMNSDLMWVYLRADVNGDYKLDITDVGTVANNYSA